MRAKRLPANQGAHEAVILFTAGGFRFAIAANAVREIRGLEGLEPRAGGPLSFRAPKVAFTLEREEATYFVVDTAKHFHLPPFKPQRVLVLRNGPVALLAETTDRILEITLLHELPLGFTRDERTWYRGLIIMDGDVVPVVNHSGFLSKTELMVLSVAMERLLADQKRTAAV